MKFNSKVKTGWSIYLYTILSQRTTNNTEHLYSNRGWIKTLEEQQQQVIYFRAFWEVLTHLNADKIIIL